MSVPTGTVTLYYNGNVQIGVATLDAGGNYTFDTSSLPQGTLPITASYSGDANFQPSVSPAVNEVINSPVESPSQTSLAAAPNPATVGQNVTLSGSVTSA